MFEKICATLATSALFGGLGIVMLLAMFNEISKSRDTRFKIIAGIGAVSIAIASFSFLGIILQKVWA